jgi:outer membrane protein assembly factor BamB
VATTVVPDLLGWLCGKRASWERLGAETLKGVRGRLAWLRRAAFAAVLALTAVTPGPASGWTEPVCGRAHCESAGTVRWADQLPGPWIAQNSLAGTTPARGQAYAALGDQVAVVGFGLTVSAYRAGSGRHAWTSDLKGFPAGSSIVSVRAWPGVVTVGVGLPSQGAPGQPRSARRRYKGIGREEVVLAAATGQLLAAHPAAPFGGAVAAGPASTVIVADHAVICYSNRTGAVLWNRPTGPAAQAWQVDGSRLYVTVAVGGYLENAPVTGLRLIDLRTGAERLIRPHGAAFAGTLSLAFGGVVIFSDASGVTAYNGTTGALMWHRSAALPDAVDAARGNLYLISGNVLSGVNVRTGAQRGRVAGATAAAPSGLYGVREGTVLGIDHGALGKAWGYDIAAKRVAWTSRPLPWPHYFVDLSGIGGSAPPGLDEVLLAICPRLGAPLAGGTGQRCERPELVAINR